MYITKEQDKYFYVKETTKGSILADTYMWASLIGAFWVNFTFIWWNNFLDTIIFIMLYLHIIWLYKNKVKKFKTKQELIDYINNLK